METKALDHVALWATERDRACRFPDRGVRHARDRAATDDFTLVGGDARRGKLTLFEAEGRGSAACSSGSFSACPISRRRGPGSVRPASARRGRAGVRVTSTRPSSLRLGLVRDDGLRRTSTTSSSRAEPEPNGARVSSRWGSTRTAARSRGRQAARAAARDAGATASVAQPSRVPRRRCRAGRGRGPRRAVSRSTASSTRRTPGPSSSGGPIGSSSSTSSTSRASRSSEPMPDLVVAGAGMAGLAAAVEAREHGADVLLLEKGDRAGRLDACSRAAWCGAIATSRASVASARRLARSCSGSSTTAWTATSPGWSGSAHGWSTARPGIPRPSARASPRARSSTA